MIFIFFQLESCSRHDMGRVWFNMEKLDYCWLEEQLVETILSCHLRRLTDIRLSPKSRRTLLSVILTGQRLLLFLQISALEKIKSKLLIFINCAIWSLKLFCKTAFWDICTDQGLWHDWASSSNFIPIRILLHLQRPLHAVFESSWLITIKKRTEKHKNWNKIHGPFSPIRLIKNAD